MPLTNAEYFKLHGTLTPEQIEELLYMEEVVTSIDYGEHTDFCVELMTVAKGEDQSTKLRNVTYMLEATIKRICESKVADDLTDIVILLEEITKTVATQTARTAQMGSKLNETFDTIHNSF